MAITSNREITEAASLLRAQAPFRILLSLLNNRLADLRDEYETAEASEFTRGRVVELKSILEILGHGE